MTKKIKVAVLYGGKSGEHEVSLQSAASVIQYLDKEQFDVIPISIDKQGNWLLNTLPDVLLEKQGALPVRTANTKEITVPQTAKVNGTATRDLFDVVFPIAHGPLYEDGSLQGLLTLGEVPFVGSSVLASAIAMDKTIAKQLLTHANIPVVPYLIFTKFRWEKNADACIQEIVKQRSFPLFVKPANLGSSVGIHKVHHDDTLVAAISDAFRFDNKILVEKAINAREIELSVLEDIDNPEQALVSLPGEIKVTGDHEFYSYTAKYLDADAAELIIPASLTEEQLREAQYIARRAFEILGCEGMARADLFLDKETGQFYFNELNTIPGFTTISMYPKLWEASGIPYSELLTKLINLAIVRHERNKAIHRDWTLTQQD